MLYKTTRKKKNEDRLPNKTIKDFLCKSKWLISLQEIFKIFEE